MIDFNNPDVQQMFINLLFRCREVTRVAKYNEGEDLRYYMNGFMLQDLDRCVSKLNESVKTK